MSTTIDTGRTKSKLPSTLATPLGMGGVISAAVTTRQPFILPKWSTLNEKYGVLADESWGEKHGKDFYLGYYGIGIGGSRSIGVGSSGIEARKVNQHKTTDGNAFYPIPFLVREITNDIDPEIRKNFRLRVVRPIGDKVYVFYYLKKIGFTEFDPSVKIGSKDPETGNETERPYVPKEEDLSPTPYELTSVNAIPLTNEYVNATGKMDLSLTESDLTEIKNVCRILFNDSSVAAINEMYLAYGVETTHDGQIGESGTVNYQELQSAVAAYVITEAWARDANTNTKMPWFFHYGNSLPLLIDQSQLAG